jgi:hypothetical protein
MKTSADPSELAQYGADHRRHGDQRLSGAATRVLECVLGRGCNTRFP